MCLEFLPELLSQPQSERQIFGIQLAGCLSRKYPIPKSLAVARFIVSKLSASALANGSNPPPGHWNLNQHFLSETLPAIVELCVAFPFLTEDVVDVLLGTYYTSSQSNADYHHNQHYDHRVKDPHSTCKTLFESWCRRSCSKDAHKFGTTIEKERLHYDKITHHLDNHP